MNIYDRVFESNRRWVAEKRRTDADFFERLAAEQKPEFLYIGCSDSRVPANEIMGLEPGEVFVHRNVANIVVNTDFNVHTVIEYAVNHLDVDHIIVCGHYGCGGIGAAMQSRDLGIMNGWLREVRDVYRLYRDELDAIEDQDTRYRRLVELNVREQCIHVAKTAAVQKAYLRRKLPVVHGWVYDLHDGLLQDLKLPFDKILEDIREIYHLDV